MIANSYPGGEVMAVSIFKYSSVNTKARALFGKLLTKGDYEELLGRRTVQDAAAYLKKNTAYSYLLSSINTNLVHRGELEKLFKTSLYEDFMKLLRFLRGGPAEFLKAAFLRYEIEDLKMLLRVVYTGRDSEAIRDSLVFLKEYSDLDFEKLTGSNNIHHIIGNLKGSEYYKVLSPFLDSTKQQNLFDMEMSLDLHFFMTILKLKDKLLSGADRESITQTFGIEIDILNILMIYRCKKLFNFPKELTVKYVIPYWYRLSREQLIHLSESRDVEEFKRHVSKTKYSHIFKADDEHLWETNSMNYMYRVYKSHLRSDCFNIGLSMAYLHLKEMDIRNIITLIEGVRYNLSREEIKSYLAGINM